MQSIIFRMHGVGSMMDCLKGGKTMSFLQETIPNIVSQWKSQGGDAAMQAYTELYAECGSPELVYSTYLPADHPAYTGKYLFNGEADMATQITAE